MAVAAATTAVFLWSRGDLNTSICDGGCGPDFVVAPRALTPDREPALADTAPPARGSIEPAKLSDAVDRALRSSDLGPHVGFAAIDPTTGADLASSGAGTYVPASTTKLLTGFSALASIDPQHRFATRVVRRPSSGPGDDRIVLVGGGDPYLVTKRPKRADRAVRADLTTLARRAAAALKETGDSSVRLGYDDSLFTGPSASPAWKPSYVSANIVTPVSALWTDQGVRDGARSSDPAAAAAARFAGLLAERGIKVAGEPRPTEAEADAPVVATVRSTTVAQIVEILIRTSDNEAAEVMLRHIAIAAGKPATFDGGTEAVVAALHSADVDTSGMRLFDGSGLSRRNRVAPLSLAQTLRAAISMPRTSGLVADLPVSGFTGTLVARFARLTSALGLVHAKTGTLSGIHSLAGYAVDAGGRPVLFAVMADRADKAMPLAAQAALDRVAAAIAGCSCGSP